MKWRAASMLMALLAACSEAQVPSDGASNHDPKPLLAAARPQLSLTSRVTDAADILDAAQEAKLSERLERLEKATGHQMVVVSVPTLSGQDVADYTRELGNAAGIGRAKEDDGVILLVALAE